MKHTNSRLLAVNIGASALAGMVILPGAAVHADPVEDLVTFTAGTTARADEVNANFSAVADAVNGNDATITDLVTAVEELRAALEALDECPTMDPSDEMVRVGGVCIDRYEASLWDAPVGGNQITGPIPCMLNGQDCDNIYARSVAGVQPSARHTWFQAQQALANSGKRLPTNAEWQMAAAGTPDDDVSCNVGTGVLAVTGSLPDCVSRWGTFDMVGNVWERVADWLPNSTADTCEWVSSSFEFSDDAQGICGAAVDGAPGSLLRGGSFQNQLSPPNPGPFAIYVIEPYQWFANPLRTGFRGAR